MENALILGNRIVKLDETTSTNVFLQEMLVNSTCFEGLVVLTKNQLQGKGQRGNTWESESGKNLTFSVLLKPNVLIEEQFVLSQVVSLGIYDFLAKMGFEQVAIKWPNDIYVDGNKIAGILIENTLSANKIGNCIVGIGLNVNQTQFSPSINATSLAILTDKEFDDKEFDLSQLLSDLLKHIEYRYLQLKAGKNTQLKLDYLNVLLGYQKPLHYLVNNERVTGIIRGVSAIGKLQVEINSQIKEFDLKEISLIS
ncbi:MAG: biotin--[acetyl-CoA-carboxylase] ligase [Flavobacteriales bacterium]|nr:biotin--[acetyl-CoA-carboxylase] ligase [Flavobacteriales bacterium]